MTSIRRTTWTPVGHPIAGDLAHGDSGPVVPITLGVGEELGLDNAAWGRDLIAAVSAAVSVLESESGLPALPELPSLNDVMDERNTYHDILTRLVRAASIEDVNTAARDAKLALEYWAGRP